jgi:phage terminase large subunit GpA-like protein
MMCNDAIRAVDWQKSARVGYTKCLVASVLYLSVHRSRNGLVYQPTDDDAKDFVIDEIDPAIAQMPIVQKVFPTWQLNDETNTPQGSTVDGQSHAKQSKHKRTKIIFVGIREPFKKDLFALLSKT